jgi:predicted Zn finger-like uncharacterized protein
MLTRCPQCETVFRLRPEQLEPAGGLVRCGNCRNVFDAAAELIAEPDAPAASDASIPDTGMPTESEPGSLPAPEAGTDAGEDVWQAPRTRSASLAPLAWAAGTLVLLLVLLLQYAHFRPEAFNAYPELRPLLVRLCATTGCTVPPLRAPGRIRLQARDVRTDPGQPGRLLANAILVNEAGYSQPYPELELTLTTTEGAVKGMRVFTPAEYLPDVRDVKRLMPPDTPVHARLELADPGNVTGYTFRFR